MDELKKENNMLVAEVKRLNAVIKTYQRNVLLVENRKLKKALRKIKLIASATGD